MRKLSIRITLALFIACAGISRADTIVGTETDAAGFIGNLFSDIQVASDGEVPFQPFNATFDCTDAIQFQASQNWTQVSNTWTQGAAGVWYLRAVNENEPASEPVGEWVRLNAIWTVPLGDYTILDQAGAVGDVIRLSQQADGAHLTFASDPLAAAPTPSTALSGLALLGVVGGGSLLRRKVKVTA